ncbi:tyrosine-type recombinase/integrase [Xanthomonas albilineans]|uniref:tyrosine-type recombinase/integrase n=1 Tax=Xanthomonas albilineans TaxID=29447 RepID=UPI0005F304A9|nr:tyrosine-type recombinase/integrase [Xanthomonas albilineans]
MARRTERKTASIDLKKVDARDKLKPRASKEPYWQPLAAGRYLGFRPSTRPDGLGTWLARFHDTETGKKPNRALGDYGTLPASSRFDAAKRDAEEWFRHLSHGGSTDDVTVREACERYAADNPEAALRFARYVYDEPIARIKLQKLREQHVMAWRKKLEATPAVTNANKKHGPKCYRPRNPATVGRDMVPFRAALNAALRRGEVLTSLAWRTALQPPKDAGGRRDVYLDRQQRRDLLDALHADVRAFVRGLSLLPLRPGALAKLCVSDFDARRNVLTIGQDKAGGNRSILIPAETAAMLKEHSKDKLPGAPLFMRADGTAWNKDAWKGPIKTAARVVGLPENTTAYALRHSTITDLVTGGLDLLTVAQISGTSVAMIEQHYGHLRREHAAAALATLVL